MNIYEEKQLLKPNFFQRLFGIKLQENATIEINNLLASNQDDVERISLDHIIEIANKYKINLKSKFQEFRLDLFQKYLHKCLEDEKLEEYEIKKLKHLRDILFLNEKDMENQIKLETEKIYEKHVKEAVRDGKLEEQEKHNLELLKRDLLISETVASKIYEINAKDVMERVLIGLISDQKFSPEDESEMMEISKSLGIDYKMEQKSQALLDKYRLYWQIENADLPELTSEINIQKSEKLHFKTSVKWLEQRRIIKRIAYSGPTLRFKIVKGVYWRAGNLGVQRISEDIWQTMDSGNIYLTNKRLIFMGSKGNKSIGLNKILDITPYKNGIEIQKDSGKSPFLEFDNNIDIFSMILVRLMNEQ